MAQFRVGLPGREIIVAEYRRIQVGGADAEAQITNPDGVGVLSEKFLQQRGPLARPHLMEQSSAAPRERVTESGYGLKPLPGIDSDDRQAVVLAFDEVNGGGFQQVGPVAGSDPDLYG